MAAGVQQAGHARVGADRRQVVGEVRAESRVRPHGPHPGQHREELDGLRREATEHLHRQGAVEADPLPAGADEDRARRGALDHGRGLQRGGAARHVGDVVRRVHLVPHHARQRFGDEDEAAAGQDGQVRPGEPGHLAAPGAGRVHHVRGTQVAGRGADAPDLAVRAGEDRGDLLAGAHPGARGAQQVGGGEGGLDLGVLGVVDAPGEAGGEVRLEVAESVGGDLVRGDARRALRRGEVPQGLHARGAGGDDEAALGLVLDRRGELVGQLAPQAGGEQGQVELGSGFLVGDQQVALAGAGGPTGDGAAVDDGDGEAGAGRVVGAGRADHARADDDDVRGVVAHEHVSNISHCTGCCQELVRT